LWLEHAFFSRKMRGSLVCKVACLKRVGLGLFEMR
jgi:hypothetical protein